MAFPTSQMHETITIYPRTGVGAYVPKFGASYEETWYIEPGFKTVTDSKGQEIVSSLFGLGPADSALNVNDEIVWNGRRYRAIDVQPLRFGGEAHHVEAYFGSVAE
ncbi:MAG: YqbH/XkdH family protein [Armatimonadetes bacterium]|nr:YqbH/XkdH family protein [Armatimonadota bacterium]